MEEDADATAILQMHNEVTQQDAPAQVQQSPTLSLQLNRGHTQHTVAEQPLEETQENEAEIAATDRVRSNMFCMLQSQCKHMGFATWH